MSDLDEASLARWMARAVPDFQGLGRIGKFPGGQSNPTYRIEAGERTYVLRRQPFGDLLPSAHAVDREYRLISALHPAGFPVPRPVALCEDRNVAGALFYMMEMVDGRSIWNGALPEIGKGERRAFYEAMIDALARLHSLDHEKIGLGGFGRAGNYFERQVGRWTKQYRAAQTDHIPEMEKLIEWLPRTVPRQTRNSIIHGDFRIDNLIFAKDRPKVLAVIDWELATIGDPLADFAYLAMNWIMPADGRSWLGGLDLEGEGLMTLDQAMDRYCDAAGCGPLPDLSWHFAYNLFRMAGILQGVKKRMADGNASSSDAEVMVAKIEPLASEAWRRACMARALDPTVSS
ncbi:phosphotransferase family protein [Sphingobium indicum]|uniref:Aminoglycoside phosphotransferase n=2 Tax=Sphingobium indicum TaxID=332055 RepID=A0A1L5BQV5_SPHIB|nr:phosphotransferase family protein [Sphingobium indicum]APL95172.1 aminoglycoside phosphotransferase [Sphingobium indicum B90A]KEY97106.1 aminoglycoside phosphotransferase [Sphingomonas sp. BHC-A]NYI23455.1 aminoglycoside phosphotransferase (APT) family kinase protein [Sphingobium indicum]RYM01677.1 phosphotransferase family protein [Sphingobium indicum]